QTLAPQRDQGTLAPAPADAAPGTRGRHYPALRCGDGASPRPRNTTALHKPAALSRAWQSLQPQTPSLASGSKVPCPLRRSNRLVGFPPPPSCRPAALLSEVSVLWVQCPSSSFQDGAWPWLSKSPRSRRLEKSPTNSAFVSLTTS